MEFHEHPAYIGFAKDSGAKREKVFKEQFEQQGFDDSVTWSLNYSIAQFIYPRLVKYYELSDQVINIDYHKGFRQAIEDMIDGFRLASTDKVTTKEEDEKIHKAWKLLGEWHSALWW